MKANTKYKKISNSISIYLHCLHQECKIKCSELVQRYPQYAPRSIYRHENKPIDSVVHDHRKSNPGQPKKLSKQDERMLLKTLFKLRNKIKSFTARLIKSEACKKHVNGQTVHRLLNESNFRYLHSRKEGSLAKKDMRTRAQFARKVIKFLPEYFWREGISFYFDGVGFTHKTNPPGEARVAGAMAWRKPSESFTSTTKAKKEGNCGKQVNFLVAVTYDQGGVCCEQYTETITGNSFAEFVLFSLSF